MATKVTVCARCRRAACWQGVFMCDDAGSASTIDAPIEQLQAEAREDPSWWDVCANHGVALRECLRLGLGCAV